jgi:hypothetical protein
MILCLAQGHTSVSPTGRHFKPGADLAADVLPHTDYSRRAATALLTKETASQVEEKVII